MTKPEAKALMIEFWGYMAKHPECEFKCDAPPILYDKVKVCFNQCPLCEVFFGKGIRCKNCILVKADAPCGYPDSSFYRWVNSPYGEAGNAIRAASAKKIADISEAWDTEEEADA